MPSCAIFGCNNHPGLKGLGDIKFYTFPKNQDLALQWLEACGRRDKINLKNAVICSKHFETKCFFTSLKYRLLNETPPKRFRNLQIDAVPTLFLPIGNSVVKSNKPLQMMQGEHDLESRQIEIERNLSDLSNSSSKQMESQIPTRQVQKSRNDVVNEWKKLKTKMISLEKVVKRLKTKNEEVTTGKETSDSKLIRIVIEM